MITRSNIYWNKIQHAVKKPKKDKVRKVESVGAFSTSKFSQARPAFGISLFSVDSVDIYRVLRKDPLERGLQDVVRLTDFLVDVPVFKGISRDVLPTIVNHLSTRKYDRGTWVFRKGSKPDGYYIILHGRVDVKVPDPKTGERVTVSTLEAGFAFGELGMKNGEDRKAGIQCTQDFTEICILDDLGYKYMRQINEEFLNSSLRVLKCCNILGDLDEGYLRKVAPFFVLKKYDKNYTVFVGGSAVSHMYVLKSGACRILRRFNLAKKEYKSHLAKVVKKMPPTLKRIIDKKTDKELSRYYGKDVFVELAKLQVGSIFGCCLSSKMGYHSQYTVISDRGIELLSIPTHQFCKEIPLTTCDALQAQIDSYDVVLPLVISTLIQQIVWKTYSQYIHTMKTSDAYSTSTHQYKREMGVCEDIPLYQTDSNCLETIDMDQNSENATHTDFRSKIEASAKEVEEEYTVQIQDLNVFSSEATENDSIKEWVDDTFKNVDTFDDIDVSHNTKLHSIHKLLLEKCPVKTTKNGKKRMYKKKQ